LVFGIGGTPPGCEDRAVIHHLSQIKNNHTKMKSILYTTALMAGIILAGCQTPAQKEESAQTNVDSAKSNLNNAKAELNAEYPAFKKDADEQIMDNDKKIAKLRAKIAASGNSAVNDARSKKIDKLETMNADLKSRLFGYETERSDWVAFKVAFNHDKDNLNQAFTDFGDDLKK
jgi:outer membrane biogenesis lipoprotein LolB